MIEFFKSLKPVTKIFFALCGTAVILAVIYAAVVTGTFADLMKWAFSQ